MKLASLIRTVLAFVFRRSRVEREMEEELRSHLQIRVDDLERQGLPRAEAERQARLQFGGYERYKEECREALGSRLLGELIADVRYCVRGLRKDPGFTVVAVITLALGIGANTAIFSLFDAVMLRFLPVQKPEELVLLQWHDPLHGNDDSRFTNALWEQLRDRQDVFSGVLASGWGQQDSFDLAQGGAVQRAAGLYASGGYFAVLGVRAAAGRLFNVDDDRPGCPPR